MVGLNECLHGETGTQRKLHLKLVSLQDVPGNEGERDFTTIIRAQGDTFQAMTEQDATARSGLRIWFTWNLALFRRTLCCVSLHACPSA